MRLPRRHPWSIACIALASLTAGAYVAVHPASPDLAAQAFRADLFADHGLVLWDGQWYGGHNTPGGSGVAPAGGPAPGPWGTRPPTHPPSPPPFSRPGGAPLRGRGAGGA